MPGQKQDCNGEGKLQIQWFEPQLFNDNLEFFYVHVHAQVRARYRQ